MDCEAFLDYNSPEERLCGNKKAKICDQCLHWLCEEHANANDECDEPAKYHRHTTCWESHIFEMYDKKKDIPKTMEGVCPRCGDGEGEKKREQPFLFVVIGNHERVCGLCKSEILYEFDVSKHKLQRFDYHIKAYLEFQFSEIQPRKKKK